MTATVCVYVVDDDCAIRDILCELLDGEGCDAHGFCASADALENLPQRRPAIIFVDLLMPDIDVEAFVDAARRIAPETTIVLMSADHRQLAATQVPNLVHLPKPFSVEQVLALLGDARKKSPDSRPSSAPPP